MVTYEVPDLLPATLKESGLGVSILMRMLYIIPREG